MEVNGAVRPIFGSLGVKRLNMLHYNRVIIHADITHYCLSCLEEKQRWFGSLPPLYNYVWLFVISQCSCA